MNVISRYKKKQMDRRRVTRQRHRRRWRWFQTILIPSVSSLPQLLRGDDQQKESKLSNLIYVVSYKLLLR